MDFLWLFWPNSIYSYLPWKWIEKLRYKDSPYIPLIGENPFYPDKDYAWYMEPPTVFPHTKRHRAMRAICKNDLKELKKVLDEGFDIDSPVDLQKEKTPLGLAAYLNRPQIIEYLILRGADVDRSDRLGNTPLMDTVERLNLECMMNLMKYGANTSKKNLFQKLPAEKALDNDYSSVKNYIENEGANKPRQFKLPDHTIKFKFEKNLEDEFDLKRKYYKTGSNYPFNSISKAYVFNLYSESSGSV